MPYRGTLALAVAAACLAPVAVSAAEKLDKDSKKWLDEVRPLLLAEEEKVFRELKDKSERDEFQKIFWARRDTDLETPANEFRTEYEKTRADVDTRFRVSGRPGSATDCGRVYILLGAPDEVKREPGASAGPRSAETWVYRDREGMKFKDGQAQIMFDAECQLPQGARLAEQMNRMAEGKIANPNIDYRKGAGGRLVKAADQLPKPSAGTALLKAPRQDFPVSAQSKMFLRNPGGGGSYVAGLIRGDASGMTIEDAAGGKRVKIVAAAQAVDESGKATPVTEREMMAEVAADNSFVASYGLILKPGTYTVNVAVLDPAGKKGSVASAPLKVPDFGTDELVLSELLILQDVQEGITLTPQDPFWAFALGNTRFLPRFDNVFKPSDSVTLLGVLYNAKGQDTPQPSEAVPSPKPDEANPKASVTVGFTISKDGKTIAQAPEQTYDTVAATPAVGPVTLAKYSPGKYVVRMKVRDNLAQKDYTKETEFEIR
jgi:GWxTD domain-containing protein